MSDLVHLHAHTTYSMLDGYGTPAQIHRRLDELGHKAVAVTDHGVVIGHVPYAREFRNSGIKPIFGVEAYIVDNHKDKEKVQESLGVKAFPHITILAATEKGYENLIRLNRIAFTDGYFYKPRIDHELLWQHQEGLVVLSGCPGGYPTRILNAGRTEEGYSFEENYERLWSYLAEMTSHIENYFIEIVPQPGYDDSVFASRILLDAARQLRIPAVLTADCHFPTPEDHLPQEILLCAGLRKRLDDPERTLRLPDYQFYCSREQLFERMQNVMGVVGGYEEDVKIALDNSVTIANMCNVEIPRAKPVVFPSIPIGHTAQTLLWNWVSAGLEERAKHFTFDRQTYLERCTREFHVIVRKGFVDYILAVADIVKWMKDRGGFVMLRGSAGGCCMLWAMGVSETDPIYHELSFERFYDDSREDPPDIDIDFEKARRPEVFEYIYNKYGRDHCAQVAALSQLKAKAAVQDVAFVYGIHRNQFSPLSDALDSKDDDLDRQLESIADPDALQVLEKHPELRIFDRIVGQCRQTSIHAAGLLISSVPLDKTIGIIVGKGGQIVAAVDKKGAADIGLLKMDLLNVEMLDILANSAKKARGSVEWMYSLDLNDPSALDLANRGYLSSIFQLDGASAARVSREIGIHTFEDLVAASALCRPGPADWVETYKRYKKNPELLEAHLQTFHPIVRPVIRKTNGILLYQEQVMAIARDLAKLEWPEVHKLRKAITSSLGDEGMLVWKEKFVNGCLANGVMQSEADHWWKSIATHGSYSFNRSHCVTYAVMSYLGLYLKAHHPDEFYESALSLIDQPFKQKQLIREFISIGGKLELLNHEKSSRSFSMVGEKTLAGGFQQLKGVGDKTAEKIMSKMPFASWADMLEALPKSVRTLLEKAHDGTQWDPGSLVYLAEWFPVSSTYEADEEWREQYGYGSLKAASGPQPKNVNIAAYATLAEVGDDRVKVLLEDFSGAVLGRAPTRKIGFVAPQVRKVKPGDFVAVNGWWSGDALYISEIQVIRKPNNAK